MTVANHAAFTRKEKAVLILRLRNVLCFELLADVLSYNLTTLNYTKFMVLQMLLSIVLAHWASVNMLLGRFWKVLVQF